MSAECLFLGWTRPCLHAAVDELVQRFGRERVLDLENLIVVLPGARAGRRLIELLVERAERDGLVLIPPLTVTTGTLPDHLFDMPRPAAGDVARLLAWMFALQAADLDTLANVFPRRPEPDDFEGWCALARLCERLHRELAGDMLTFADVAKRGEELPDFNEQDRWLALETVRRLYLARLDELELADRDAARMGAVERRACRTEKTVVLLATTDLNLVVRRMIEQVAAQEKGVGSLLPERPEGCFAQKTPDPFFQSWVFAPKKMAERFDELGCTRVEAWRDAEIDLRTEQVEIVERPSDQAAAVLRAIAAYGARHAAAEITVGVPDEEVVPYIGRQFEQHELVARSAAGVPVGRTGPFRLLEVVGDFAERRRAADFAALVRHPDVRLWLQANMKEKGVGSLLPERPEGCFAQKTPDPFFRCDDPITALDEFTAEHLQATLREGKGVGSLLPERPAGCFAQKTPDPFFQAYRQIEQWLTGLAGRRPLAEWAEPLLELMLTVYGGRKLDRNDAADRVVIQACESIHAVLQQLHGLDPRTRPVVDAATALQLALQLAEGESIPPPPRRDAIELLGWLELPLDDAPALIVTGFNEGLVPQSVNSDPFLPNRLREKLGLLDNDRRYARDAYSLAAILASHAEKGVGSLLPERPEGCFAQKTPDPFFRSDVKIIAGRRRADLEPLTPSRLLFACDDQTIARRIPVFFPDEKGVGSLLPERPARCFAQKTPDPFVDIPKPAPLVRPITSMRVTEFRDYLACPYRYYLRHVLKLAAIEPADELDGARFGTLTHDVLERFGSDPIKDSTDAESIRGFLHDQIDRVVAERFGADAVPAVRVQIEQLRLRLDAFANWQAKWRAEGWRIEQVERKVTGEDAPFEVDGQPMFLRGRIDRIDCHERDGTWCVLDYKTGEDGDKPDKALGRDGRWHDLQLPLYRHLVRAIGITGDVQLGYIVLPRDPVKVGVLVAGWTADELASADEAACEVIRGIRTGKFPDRPTEPPPRGFDEFAWICQESRTVPLLEKDEEVEP